MKQILSFTFLLCITRLLFAQDTDEVSNRLMVQLAQFPHEKIYVQTDKSAYLSGERVWFRSHLVDAASHKPAFLSRYVYIELFNPFDELLKRIKVRPDSTGVYSGYLDLDEELPEGGYTIRAYTRYMRNQGNEAFYKKTIQILDPYSLQIEPIPDFTVNGNRVNVNFRFADPASGTVVAPEIVTYKLLDEAARSVSPDNNNNFKWNFSIAKKSSNRVFLLGIVHNGRKYNRYYAIPHDANDFDITFHPEGGYLVPGKGCQVGFKAINPSGQSEEITGILYNSKDEEVAQFNSLKSGMGFLNFMPEANEKYYAVCKTSFSETKRFDLPLPDSRARTVAARITGGNRLVVSILKGDEAPSDSVYILMHHKGLVFFHQPWNNQLVPFSFTTNNFPTGILSILLLNQKNEILSERMVFNLNADDFAELESESTPVSKRRELISLRLKLTDSDTITFSDNIAVSVTDKKVVRQDTTNSLLSTLLLSSELKGHIESPGSYFDGFRITDKYALDALMMTQGWRRYDIPNVLQGNLIVPDQFAPEEFQEISGRSEVLFGGLKEGNISLYATLDTLYSGETTTADEKGRFMFKVEYPEGTEITVQSLSKKGGRHNLINIDPVTFPDYTFSTISPRALTTGQSDKDLEAYLQKANEEYTQKFGIRTIMLEEVTVTAQSMEKYKASKFYSPIHATGMVTADEIDKRKVSSLRSLLVSTPGIIVKSDRVTSTRSDSPVLFVIDDMTYTDFFDQIDLFDVSAIDNLFVMRDNIGMLGYYPDTEGAVVITTKGGFVQKNVKSMNIDRIKPLGYQLPVEFYSPAYETQEQKELSAPDHRTTIFWKPNVQFSKEGEVLVEFYSADTPTTYEIIGEGMTSSGKIIRLEKEITIEGTY